MTVPIPPPGLSTIEISIRISVCSGGGDGMILWGWFTVIIDVNVESKEMVRTTNWPSAKLSPQQKAIVAAHAVLNLAEGKAGERELRSLLLDDWHGLQRLRLDLLAALSYQRLGYQERAQSLLVQCLIGAEREEARSLFVEDMARNLTPAKALGMTTVWLDNGSESGHRDHLPDQVDFHVSDLADWLDSLPAPWGIS